MQTQAGLISKPPLCYDAGMNNDVKILLAKLSEVLAVPEK